MTKPEEIQQAIAALEAQRAILGDRVVEIALAPLREQLAALVAAEHEAPQQLKYVTVLFTDVAGSTHMSQRLDPEDILAIMDGALERFRTTIDAHDGRVLRFMGDGLKAVFGGDIGHEDDAERAVRAGLALLADAQVYAESVEQHWGISDFTIRVGINTGQVILGGGVEADNTATGMTINLAARMESSAPPGGLRISHATYRHVRGVFDVVEQPPLQVKGADVPLRTYLVQRAKPRAFRVATRGIEGIETRMVGRAAELRHLQESFDSTVEDRCLALVTVVADAGIGKSRLLYEFQNWLDLRSQTVWLFQGRAHPQMVGQPYGLMRDLLAWRFQILDSDNAEVARAKLVQGIAPLFRANDDAAAHFLGQLIGLDFASSPHLRGILNDAQQIRDRAFHAAAQFFRALSDSDGSPVVLLLDDLQWADDGSLDLLNHLAQCCDDLPLLIVGLARPTLYERRPLWGSGQATHTRVDLHPLSRRDRRNLTAELLQRLVDAPAVLRELITSGGEGNPFYMEELVKMLIDDGVIVMEPNAWRVVGERLLQTRVPPTLTGVLQARLDGLPPEEKATLQQAAVVGYVFWDEAVALLHPPSENALSPLTGRELILGRETSTFDGAHEYVFKHHVLHEVTYDSLLKRVRRAAHQRVADWLATRSGERVGEYLGLIAEHYERAGDSANAANYLQRAGEEAAARFANEAALNYLQRAIDLIPEHDAAKRYTLLLSRERVYHLQGSRDLQRADLAALEALADFLDDDARRAVVAVHRAEYSNVTSAYPEALAAAQRAMALAERAGVPEVVAGAEYWWACALWKQGDYDGTRVHIAESLRLAHETGDYRNKARALNILALCATHTGDLVAAREGFVQSLALLREIGDLRSEFAVLNNLGDAVRRQGDYADARTYFEQSLDLTRRMGDRHHEAFALANLGLIAHNQRADDIGRDWSGLAATILHAIGDFDAEAYALTNLGHTLVRFKLLDQAAAAYQQALDIRHGLGQPHMATESLAGLARVALARGEVAQAAAHVETILAHLRHGGTVDGTDEPLRIYLTVYQALAAAQDTRAQKMLELAHDQLQEQAARLTDEAARRMFREQVPYHHEIMAAWENQGK
jgi:class 3 adenylate cyclase/tetratricopeptide (TPR) repeat protein